MELWGPWELAQDQQARQLYAMLHLGKQLANKYYSEQRDNAAVLFLGLLGSIKY